MRLLLATMCLGAALVCAAWAGGDRSAKSDPTAPAKAEVRKTGCCGGGDIQSVAFDQGLNHICPVYETMDWGGYCSYYALHYVETCGNSTPTSFDGACGLKGGCENDMPTGDCFDAGGALAVETPPAHPGSKSDHMRLDTIRPARKNLPAAPAPNADFERDVWKGYPKVISFNANSRTFVVQLWKVTVHQKSTKRAVVMTMGQQVSVADSSEIDDQNATVTLENIPRQHYMKLVTYKEEKFGIVTGDKISP